MKTNLNTEVLRLACNMWPWRHMQVNVYLNLPIIKIFEALSQEWSPMGIIVLKDLLEKWAINIYF